jgi:hypothetical protein
MMHDVRDGSAKKKQKSYDREYVCENKNLITPHGLNTAFLHPKPSRFSPLPQAEGVAVTRLAVSEGNPTHRTPHSPTLITAGVEDDEILVDAFVGGKSKGIWHRVEWHYGGAQVRFQTPV